MSENVSETPPTEDQPQPARGPIRRLEDAVHDRLLAARVAAEESAGYGSVTAAVEAAEAAVNPDHELQDGEGAADETAPAPDPPRK
jgi:hypothetical protein